MAIIFQFINILLLGICIGLFVHYWIERKLVREFAIRAAGMSTEPIKAVLSMAGEIFRTNKSWHRAQPFIPLPIFSGLGITPGSILRTGGCCSDIARLTIVSLYALGFKSASITLCNPSGEATHCLIEVSLEKHNALIDPTHGFYYVDELGKEIGLLELQSGTRPSFASLPYSNNRRYPSGSCYNFDFSQAKTANWTQDCVRKAVYRVLVFVTKGTIDRVKQPAVLEWPQLVLATSLIVFFLFMNLARLLI